MWRFDSVVRQPYLNSPFDNGRNAPSIQKFTNCLVKISLKTEMVQEECNL
jgi:hypothetical protein